MVELINFYFIHANLLLPLLHRPTFEKGIADGYHRRSSDFGGTVLLVCAIGSRYSTDPRVFLPEANSDHSAGWKWFDQVQMVQKSRLAAPSLYDLQKYCVSVGSYIAGDAFSFVYQLSVVFLNGASAPQACWTMVGIGIRMAQDVCAHRRK